jgi:DNA-binding response OmpR family regulator
MSRSVLICDDEAHIVRAAEFKFKKGGYEVVCAYDGEEGWEILQKFKPDIIITDYQMPRMDGLELIDRIRSNPATADIPIIMLTAKGFEISHETTSRRFGVIAVLPKPFSPRELFHRVEEILDQNIKAGPAGIHEQAEAT